ncbi:hypothetical protein [Roseomonas genomospecies 6]|uniref:Lipoprotein n=1 Tax=Roseomonas genomospecies 6 TaxID=214106 RepID=A0A9W7NN71_9PROT|nr:hypothetical protein [Roseomonas genomospecies 6]KAA0683606.1 hypothetical protein DS843_04300 [Roseomonas genomospecies 6]
MREYVEWGMKGIGVAVATVVAVLVSGCAPPASAPFNTTAGIASTEVARVEVKDDSFEKLVKFQGPRLSLGYQPYGILVNAANLRSWVDRASGSASHQLYVVDYYEGSGWKFWSRVNGQGGDQLEFVSINREVGSCGRYTGCGHYETFGATIPDKVLRDHASTGYSVKFFAKNGEEKVVTITPQMISLQIEAIDKRFPPKVEPAKTESAPAASKKPAKR